MVLSQCHTHNVYCSSIHLSSDWEEEEEEEDHTNNAPGLQVPGLDLTLPAGLPVLLQSCLSASWDSFDDKFSLLPGVSTPLDQNTVKHSLVGLSVLASLNRLNPECKLDY